MLKPTKTTKSQILPIKKALAILKKEKRAELKASVSKNFLKKTFKLSDRKIAELPELANLPKTRFKKTEVALFVQKEVYDDHKQRKLL